MALTLFAKGWSRVGATVDQREENVTRYIVSGLPPGSYDVCIDRITNIQDQGLWQVLRNYQPINRNFASPQAALEALEAGEVARQPHHECITSQSVT